MLKYFLILLKLKFIIVNSIFSVFQNKNVCIKKGTRNFFQVPVFFLAGGTDLNCRPSGYEPASTQELTFFNYFRFVFSIFLMT